MHRYSKELQYDTPIDLVAHGAPPQWSLLVENPPLSNECRITADQPEHTEAADIKWPRAQSDREEQKTYPTATDGASASGVTQRRLTHNLQHTDILPTTSMDEPYALTLVGKALQNFWDGRVESKCESNKAFGPAVCSPVNDMDGYPIHLEYLHVAHGYPWNQGD